MARKNGIHIDYSAFSDLIAQLDDLGKNIADIVAESMEEAGKTRTDIGNALGISYYTVTDWVKGKKMPRMDKVEKLAKYFDCLISELIEEKQEQPAESELSIKKKEFIRKVEGMSDAQLERLEQILTLVEQTEI